ncbi:MAG: hypothetical protein GY835_08120 [bacterium]|nr:hypothetical protein [bacterium]
MTTRGFLTLFQIPLIAVIFLPVACSPLKTEEGASPPIEMSDIQVPAGFHFEVRREHELTVAICDIDGAPYTTLPVRIHDTNEQLLVEGVTDDEGMFTTTLILALGQNQVVVEAPAIGIVESKNVVDLIGETTELRIE